MPPPSTEGFQVLELLAEFLGGKNTALLQTAFRQPENQDLVNDISTDLGFNRDFAYLKISAELPLQADESRVIAIITGSIKKLAREGVPEEAVQRALVQRAAQEIFTQEKLHYYGMMKAGYLAAGGYGFLRDYVAALQAVRAQDLRRMATTTLVNATPVITLMQPRPPRDTTRAQQSARAWHSETLDNGMQVVIQYNADSPVVGMHLLAKDPACLAGREKWGITDVLQRAMRTGGTKARPGPAFEDAVEALGAELKMHDNPWIPYDDYYHSPRFSYIRLKVVGTRFGDASTLLADVVRNARLNGPAVEDARKQVLSLAERAAASTPAVAKRLFYDNLFADNPGFGYELGLPEQVHNLTADAVRTFYRQLYAPGNLLLTISGNIPIEQAMAAVKRAFEGTWGEKVAVPEQPLQFSQFGRTVRQRVGKKQSYIYVANRFSVARDDLPALRVLMALFSDRLAFDLREKQGLAYSIGASARRLGGLDWYTVRMGTRPDNIDRALQGIRRKIADMRSSAIPEHEMRKTINSLLGRHGMRRLDRAGKAYTIAMQVLDGNPAEADDAVPDRLKRVTLADLRRLQKSVFSRDDHLVVIVE